MSDAVVMVVFVTGPDRDTLSDLGRTIVSERLAACVNVHGEVRSIYRWEGKVADESEAMAMFKTSDDRVAELEARVRALHPYTEPEFLALEVKSGSRTYMDWVIGSVASDQ